MFKKRPINIGITVARDSTTAEVLPAVIEVGLHDPLEIEEFGVIYGWVERKKVMLDIAEVAGVIAVERQTRMRGANSG